MLADTFIVILQVINLWQLSQKVVIEKAAAILV
jgi:hypothetical protein